MTAARRCKVLGKWRFIEADQWDRAYLDLVEPAYIRFDVDVDGRGEVVFGAIQAGWSAKPASAPSSSISRAATR